MLAVEFEGSNFIFKKPHNMSDEECRDLSVFKGPIISPIGIPTPGIISCWKFSKEDLERIAETGVVWLHIVGEGMPPVSIFTEDPFTHP